LDHWDMGAFDILTRSKSPVVADHLAGRWLTSFMLAECMYSTFTNLEG
jgi:hypothetical protein